jgi:3-oxoacyl-[acyl-carrier protein] reductase
MSFRLDGKVALVTGGARGIGRATVEYLADHGAKIFLVDIDEEVAKSAEQELKEREIDVCAMAADIADADAADRVVDACVERFEKIDILVNNAGITRDALAIRMKNEDWEAVIRVNLSATFFMARAAAKKMIRERSGRIINVASVVGIMGNPGQANYSASKAGVIGLTKTLAKELATRGITVNAVAPGFIETRMTSVLKDEVKEAMLKTIPLGRYGKPRDIAAAIGFLASDEAGYITGHVLSVDGGQAM